MDRPSYLTDCNPRSKAFPRDWKVAHYRLGGGASEGYRCAGCSQRFFGPGGFEQLHADHVRSRAEGGRTTWENLRLLCWPCKISKGDWEFGEVEERISATIHSILDEKGEESLRIMFLAAEPRDQRRVSLDREARAIEREIQSSKYHREMDFRTQWAVTADELPTALLRHRPHILHISGHGDTEGVYFLEQQDGSSELFEYDRLASLLEILQDDLSLIVLNTCNSASFADKVVQSIPLVVGMPSELATELAIEFSSHFYRGIGFGRTLEESYELGKHALARRIPQDMMPRLVKQDH